MAHRKLRFWRLAASLLAATGLLGHGIAMLLAAWLTAAPAAAEAPGFGAICSAGGASGSAPEDQHPTGPHHPCPVCTAFAQAGTADLPATMPLRRTTAAGLAPTPQGETTTAVILAAPPRAPPAG